MIKTADGMNINKGDIDSEATQSSYVTLRRSTRYAKNALATAMVVFTLIIPTAQAQTFNQIFEQLLADETSGGLIHHCAQLVGDDFDMGSGLPLGFGPKLTSICNVVGPPAGGPPTLGTSSVGGAATSEAGANAVERRKRDFGKEEDIGNGGSGGDVQIGFAHGINIWLSAHYDSLDRDQTLFEDGYDSDRWGLTMGADKHVTDWLLAGAAVNYYRWYGDYKNVGDFETIGWGPILYAIFTPWDRFFADLQLQYTTKDVTDVRQRVFQRSVNNSMTIFSGTVTGEPDAKEYSANAVAGYDFPIHNLSIGPRIGLRYRNTKVDAYEETGSSGLELRYLKDEAESLQSTAGLHAAAAINTRRCVLTPYLDVDWTHEFRDDQRWITAQFAQDLRPSPTLFSFQTDKPDRDFFHAGAGVVAVFPRGLQGFVHFEALLGHDYFEEYKTSVGLRLEL